MMSNSVVVQQVVKQLDRLPFGFQRMVLDFAQALVMSLPRGVPGKQLLRFAGTIELDDIQTMKQAIEAECERVDVDEW